MIEKIDIKKLEAIPAGNIFVGAALGLAVRKINEIIDAGGSVPDLTVNAAAALLLLEKTGTQFIGGCEFCIMLPETRKVIIDLLKAIK